MTTILESIMVDLTNYPFPTYEPNKPAAGVLASLIGSLLIVWIVQSIQAHCKPTRPIILILVGHLTLFIELVLRGALPTNTRNWSKICPLSHRLFRSAGRGYYIRRSPHTRWSLVLQYWHDQSELPTPRSISGNYSLHNRFLLSLPHPLELETTS